MDDLTRPIPRILPDADPTRMRGKRRLEDKGGERTLTVSDLLQREQRSTGVWTAVGVRLPVEDAAAHPSSRRHPAKDSETEDRGRPRRPVTADATPIGFPVPTRAHPETSFAAIRDQSLLQCGRILLKWGRDPLTTIQALVYPAVTLVMLWLVLSNSIETATGVSALDGLVPMSILVGSMAGAVAGAVNLIRERRSGLVARFAALPNHRAAPLLGRLMADTVRVAVTTVVLIVTGILLGFEFHQGFLAGVGVFFIPLLFGISYSVMATAAAVITSKTTFVELLSLSTSILMFFNTGFVPIDSYPEWLRIPVQYQPMSCVIDTMRGLSAGGPILSPLLWSIGWTVLLLALFAGPAVKGYARAAGGRD